jgi:hypothetical protein
MAKQSWFFALCRLVFRWFVGVQFLLNSLDLAFLAGFLRVRSARISGAVLLRFSSESPHKGKLSFMR